MEERKIKAGKSDAGKRLDRFIAESLDGLSRERIKKLFGLGYVTLNGNEVKPSRKTLEGDEIRVVLPEAENTDAKPENIPINIVYEDEDIVVVDKAQGMVVHPANGNYTGTLVNALLYHVDSLSEINGVIRPGIVHRIDKDTSGLLVVAKNDAAHLSLSEQFRDHSITRAYRTVCHGVISENEFTVNAPIGRHAVKRKEMCVTDRNSKKAVTHGTVLKRYQDYTFLDMKLETGRTHQIRVHLKYIGHPVIGDPVYGKNTSLDRQFEGQLLHAYRLGFIHPKSGEYIEFESELPEYFHKLV